MVEWTSLLSAKISVLQDTFFFSSDVSWNPFTRHYLTEFLVACSQIILQRSGNEFISNFFPVSLPGGWHFFLFHKDWFLVYKSGIQNLQASQTKTWNQIMTSYASMCFGNILLKEKMSRFDLYSLWPKKNTNSVDGLDFMADTMHLSKTDNTL